MPSNWWAAGRALRTECWQTFCETQSELNWLESDRQIREKLKQWAPSYVNIYVRRVLTVGKVVSRVAICQCDRDKTWGVQCPAPAAPWSGISCVMDCGVNSSHYGHTSTASGLQSFSGSQWRQRHDIVQCHHYLTGAMSLSLSESIYIKVLKRR